MAGQAGGAYGYAVDAAVRAACDANYSLFYRGVPNPATVRVPRIYLLPLIWSQGRRRLS